MILYFSESLGKLITRKDIIINQYSTTCALGYTFYYSCSLPSNGLGRSGAFCTLYTVLERVKAEQVVDVFQAIKTLRIQRVGLMESLVSV